MRYILKDLDKFSDDKFVLLSGPRQVGKTTIAKEWLRTHTLKQKTGIYLNWDIPLDRAKILQQSFLDPLKASHIVFDELHKYQRWKSLLKGLYDGHHQLLKVVVTGSARLDVFQKSGDSLFGRYERLRLHPLTIGELEHGKLLAPPKSWIDLEVKYSNPSLWKQLSLRSGFPEPFYKDDSLQHKRWSTRRRSLLIQEDLRELSQFKTLSLIENLALLLPERCAQRLSINALREELNVAHDTLNSWLDALERLYFCFRLSPYSTKIARSIRKEQKLYLWDWSQIKDPGARFENMVASHLLKSVDAWNDLGYGEFRLQYLRTVDKQEIDFIITADNLPVVAIETKLSRDDPSPAFEKLGNYLESIPKIQLVEKPGIDKKYKYCRVVSADTYLSRLS
ncbi:ATP-binding protein [bacterium]|nr:ATP-binding protein [bacterium]